MSVRHYMQYWHLFKQKEISRLREELRRREADWKTLHRLIDGAWSHDAAMAASKWPGERKEVAE